MNKIITLLFLCIMTSLSAQNYEIIKTITVADSSSIQDFQKTSQNFLLLNEDNDIITLDKSGLLVQSNAVSEFQDTNSSNLVSLNKDNTEQIRTVMGLFAQSRVKGSEYENARLMAFGDGEMFTCITPEKVTGEKMQSWSSKIISVDNNNQILPFNYIIGNPAGLYYRGDYLFYLSKTIGENSSGILITYNVKTKERVSMERIPVNQPAGIYVDQDGTAIVFSNETKELVFLKK